MGKNLRILLAEDEETIADALIFNLEHEGYEVVHCRTGKIAIDTFNQQRFNLIILDVMMPEIDGYEVCQQIRLTNDEVPIMFLTAKGNVNDKIFGLKKGADDYLTKPFNLEEFLLRVKILIDRGLKISNNKEELTTFEFGGNKIDFLSYEAYGQHGFFKLSKREVLLLKLLIERENEVVSRKDILTHVWGYDVFPSTRTIDNFIVAFRKYFEKNPKKPQYFLSVRGIGYKFACDIAD